MRSLLHISSPNSHSKVRRNAFDAYPRLSLDVATAARSLVCAALLASASFSLPVSADIFVITGANSENSKLTKNQVVNIFLGRSKAFPGGGLVSPVDLNPENPVRERFYLKLTGKNAKQISAYWARLLFTGRHSPPRVVDGEDELAEFLESNRSAIAYTDDRALAEEHDILYVVEE